MPTIRITFPNGDMFDVDAQVIARSRASYYAQLDVERGDSDDFDKSYEEELAYALRENFELSDWLFNNMNWSDVLPFAKEVKPLSTYDYQRQWGNAQAKVIP